MESVERCFGAAAVDLECRRPARQSHSIAWRWPSTEPLEAGTTADFELVDFFSDEGLNADPYPCFEHLRSKCPVTPLAHHGVLAVTGYEEASEIYRDPDTFSSCNSVVGPFAMFPVPLVGDDIGEIIGQYRDQLPMHEHMVTMDPRSTRRSAGC